MITKDQLLTALADDAITLLVPALTLSFLTEFNFAHAIIGALGQLIAIGAKKISKYNKGETIKKEPLWYWIVSIGLGAVLAFVGTPYVCNKFELNELLVSGALGSVAQYTFDFINAFKDSILKTLGNEKDAE